MRYLIYFIRLFKRDTNDDDIYIYYIFSSEISGFMVKNIAPCKLHGNCLFFTKMAANKMAAKSSLQ